YEAIANLDRLIVLARVSKTGMPVRIPTGQVVSEQIVAFPTDASGQLAVLSSSMHYWWALRYSGDMRGDLRYAPSDVYETFPRPRETARLTAAGTSLEKAQRDAMASRSIGLTKLYNLVHTKDEHANDIASVRAAHIEVDAAVVQAYGWDEVTLVHGLQATPRGPRFPITPALQT
ncbi:type IIL restriction-modification enzyme MmeI, partial [Streptomyces rubiginosohelvolus]